MQKILGDAKSVKSLLSQKYQIDYYQRDYNWEKKQVDAKSVKSLLRNTKLTTTNATITGKRSRS